MDIREAIGAAYSGLEEAKADVVGMFALKWLVDRDVLPKARLEEYYASYVAGIFRTVRFGTGEAHGRAEMMEFNYLSEQGAIAFAGGRYHVDYAKMPAAIEQLAKELLEQEATGDRARTEAWFSKYDRMPQALTTVLGARRGRADRRRSDLLVRRTGSLGHYVSPGPLDLRAGHPADLSRRGRRLSARQTRGARTSGRCRPSRSTRSRRVWSSTSSSPSQITGAEFGRMAAFCVLLTLAMGVVARLAAIPLRLNRQTLSSFLLVVMFSNSGNYALPVVLVRVRPRRAGVRERLLRRQRDRALHARRVRRGGQRPRQAFGRALAGIVRVPAIYAVAAAALILTTHTSVPPAVMRPIALLSDAAIPVMLLILGMQLERAAMPDRPAAVGVAVGLSLRRGARHRRRPHDRCSG